VLLRLHVRMERISQQPTKMIDFPPRTCRRRSTENSDDI
jgi:hypothetical protein